MQPRPSKRKVYNYLILLALQSWQNAKAVKFYTFSAYASLVPRFSVCKVLILLDLALAHVYLRLSSEMPQIEKINLCYVGLITGLEYSNNLRASDNGEYYSASDNRLKYSNLREGTLLPPHPVNALHGSNILILVSCVYTLFCVPFDLFLVRNAAD